MNYIADIGVSIQMLGVIWSEPVNQAIYLLIINEINNHNYRQKAEFIHFTLWPVVDAKIPW